MASVNRRGMVPGVSATATHDGPGTVRRYEPRTPHPRRRVFLLDHHDSFVHNVVHLLTACGARVEVAQAECIEAADAMARCRAASHVVLSPGPGHPDDARVATAVAREALGGGMPPLWGICLGHQAIARAGGAEVARAKEVVHGRGSEIRHDGSPLFRGLGAFVAGRYNSLLVVPETIRDPLVACAWSPSGEVMALRHGQHAVFGVQFHPESVLSEGGATLAENFLSVGDEGA